jgi:hypothetical protein
MITIDMLLGTVIVLGGFGVIILWVTNYFTRIEPMVLRKLSERLGLKIVRVERRWQINNQHSWQQGCLVDLLDILAIACLFVAPMWMMLGLVLVVLGLLGGI